MKAGWQIWKQRRVFMTLAELMDFAEKICESSDIDVGGTTTMVGYSSHRRGFVLESITDWDDSVIDQVEVRSEFWEPLYGLVSDDPAPF